LGIFRREGGIRKLSRGKCGAIWSGFAVKELLVGISKGNEGISLKKKTVKETNISKW
jgi:hypothetical protein